LTPPPDSSPDASSGRVKLLGLETSSPLFSVAVSDGPAILACEQVQGQGRPSALLTDLIEQALEKAGFPLSGLDGLAISIGPGSFTGLRVGVMTIKALAWALQKPALPVSSLEVIAWNLQRGASNVHPFLDARKGNVYMAHFQRSGDGSLERLSADELLRPEQALQRINLPAVLAGDGLRRYATQVAAMDLRGVELAPEDLWIPRADRLCQIAHSRWPAGIVDDPHRLVPQYLYTQESDITGR